MEAYRSQIILACVGAYFVVCIVVGLWAMRRTQSVRDFFMAGRDLGIFVTAIAIFSSTMSGFGFVGGPGLVYRMGTSSFWIVITGSIGYLLTYFVLGRRLRMLAELRGLISLPDAVTARYRSRWAGLLAAIAILLGVMGYLGTQIAAMATVLRSLLSSFIDAPLLACAVFSTALLIFYCVTGGIIASVYTDLVQGGIMIVAAAFVFLAAFNSIEGGFAGMSQAIMADDAGSIGPWGTRGMLGSLSWYFVFALGGMGQPHVITKLMMTRRLEDARMSLPVSILGYSMTALLWIGIGLAMRTLVLQGAHPSLARADFAAPEFLQTYTGPVLAGVVFAGLFAAIMSTADAFLNIGAAAVVHDIPRAIRGRSLKRELLWARVATAAIAIIAMVFALYSGGLVALLGAFGWGTFAAALVPTVGLGLVWKRATASAACLAIASSLLINFSVRALGITLPFNLDVGAVALTISLSLFIVVSLASTPPEIDPDIEAVM